MLTDQKTKLNFFRKKKISLLTIMIILSITANSKAAELRFGPISILFVEDSAGIDEVGIEAIMKLSDKLKSWNVTRVMIESNTNTFSDKNNSVEILKLGQLRCDNVLRLMQLQSGLSLEKFECINRDVDKPLSPDNSKETKNTEKSVKQKPNVKIGVLYEKNIPLEGKTNTANKTKPNQPPITSRKKIPDHPSLITASFRDVSIGEAYEILSKKERVNIVLEKGVTGKISLNLYDVTLKQAISAIAEASGYYTVRRQTGYLITKEKSTGRDDKSAKTVEATDGKLKTDAASETLIMTFKLQFANPDMVQEIMGKYVTDEGTVAVLAKRKIVVIEDTAASLLRLKEIMKELDVPPYQILIEAKILEITLDESEKFGLDWTGIFTESSTNGDFGTIGLSNFIGSGLFLRITNPKFTNILNALSENRQVRTLSTPKLLTLENHEASVIIGDRKGYKVTTTINQVTTESIQFLESGVILKVTPSIDNQGRILMRIHPEVSNGSISNEGVPTQNTTEVTTVLLANDGQPIFIGGLIKNSINSSRAGIPLLMDIPFIGNLFSNIKEEKVSTETIVVITPHIINRANNDLLLTETQRMSKFERKVQEEKVWTKDLISKQN